MKTIARKLSRVHLRLLGLAAVLLIAAPPRAGAQQAIGGLRIERTGHTATRLPGGKILVVGGENRSGSVRDSEVFDPSSRTFSAATGLLTARADHTATILPDGRLFVIGGRASGKLLDSTEFYDPETGVFSSGPALNHARAGHTATLLLDGRIAVIGGDADGSVETLDPAVGVFRLIEARLAVARKFHAAVLLKSGDVLIAGGVASGGAVLNSAELLDTGDLTFLPISLSMRVARSRPTLRVLPDGKVQAIGGDPEATMELFNPDGGYFSSLAHPAANPALLAAALKTQTRAVALGHPLPMKLRGTAEFTATEDDVTDRSGYSLTEIPELNQALAAGGTTTSGKLKTNAALFASSAATVTTDKTDYAPGETVIITGTGWQPGETVSLNIHRDTNDPPDTVLTAVADAGGNIENSEYVVLQSDLGVTFLLTATGQTSGFTAQTTFTDSRTITNVTLNGGSSVTVTPSASITAVVSVTTDNGGGNQNWRSTSWRIDTTPPGTTTCVDHADHDGNGSYTETITITAPAVAGTYNAYFLAHRDDVCTAAQQSNLFTLTNGVIVNGPPTVAFTTAPATANEGETKHYVYTVTDSPGDTFTVVAGFPTCGTGNTLSNATTTTGGGSFDCTFTDGPQSPNVQIQVQDSVNNLSNTATQAVTVSNVAPTVAFTTAPATANEGETKHYVYTVTDPGVDTFTVAAGFPGCGAGNTLSNATTTTGGGSFDCTFTDGPQSPSVQIKVTDSDGADSSTGSQAVTVANVAPTVGFTTAPTAANEGETKHYVYTVTDPGVDTFTVAAGFPGCGAGNTLSNATTTTGGGSFDCTFTNGPQSPSVQIKVTDSDGADSNTASQGVTVANVAPTVTLSAGNDTTVNEGTTAHTYNYTISDPGQDTISSVTTSCGANGTKVAASDTNTNTSGSFQCTFPDGPAISMVSASATDSDNETGALATQAVTVNNVAPAVVFLAPAATANEGATVMFTFSISDPGQDSFSVASASCGAQATVVGTPSITGNSGMLACKFLDGPSTQTVSIQVNDGDPSNNLSNLASTDVAVANVAPTVAFVTPTTPVTEGSDEVTYNFSITDPGDDTFSFMVTPSCGTHGILVAGSPTITGSTGSFKCTFPDGPEDTTLSVQVKDSDDAPSNTATTDVHINNAPPAVSVTGPSPVNEGQTPTYTFTVTDAGQDTFSVAAGYPDCGTGGSYVAGSLTTGPGGGSFKCSFPDGPASPTVSMQVNDSDNAPSNTGTFAVTVNNVAPAVVFLAPAATANEGATVMFTFSISDPGQDSFSVASASCGAQATVVGTPSITGNSGMLACKFLDGPSTQTVSIQVNDGDPSNNLSNLASTDVAVANVAPTVAFVTPTTPVTEGSDEVTYNFSITDPGDDTFSFMVTPSCGTHGILVAGSPTITGSTGSFKCTFPDGPEDTTLSVQVKDSDDAPSNTATTDVHINNAPPAVSVTGPSPVNEGQTPTYTFTVTDAGQDTFSVAAGYPDCGTGGSYVAGSLTTGPGGGSFKCSFPDGPASPTVSMQVNDSDDAPSNIGTFDVTVNNVSPTAALGNNGPVNEGSPATISFSGQSDPSGPDTAALHYAYACDGSSLAGATSAGSGTGASTMCTFNDNGTYSVRARIIDKDGGFNEYTTTVTVINVAPSAVMLSLAASTINENGQASLSGSFTDPGSGDTHTVTIVWGDGSPNSQVNLAAGVTTFASVLHTYLDDNPTGTPSDPYPISVTVSDDDGGIASASTSILVSNVAPVITSITGGPTAPIVIGSTVTMTANFTDVGTQDTHTCKFDWDDGTTTPPALPTGTLSETNGSGSCTASHTYNTTGVNTIRVTVKDDDTGSITGVHEFAVVYDPSAGFVTGGGWINSPAGSDAADPSLTGKASFGFVSKYKKGSNVPEGETEFQFKAGDINFHSSSYDPGSLVISGKKATYRGTGTINGVPGFEFRLIAYDGDQGGVDKFRIKITQGGSVIYDNRMGVSEDLDNADPTALGGGSIVIHK